MTNNLMKYKARLALMEDPEARNRNAELRKVEQRRKAVPPLSKEAEYWGRVYGLVCGGMRLRKAEEAVSYVMSYWPNGGF